MKRLIYILFISIFTISLYAQPQSNDHTLPVPYVRQDTENTYWCWAAVITSVVKYYGHNEVELCNVLQVAKNLDPSLDPNYVGVPCCGNNGACRFTNFSLSGSGSMIQVLNHWIASSGSGDPKAQTGRFYLQFSGVKANIDARKPIIVLRKYTTTGKFHALLIIGYNASDNNNTIIYFDPARTDNNLIQREPYSTFLNGNGYQWYGTMWLLSSPQYYSDAIGLSGPDVVCSNPTTFTVSNLPPNTTVNWYKSSNLTYISGQNTNSYTVKSNGNGSGLVRATVSISHWLLEKNVTVGVSPVISNISGPRYNTVGAFASYYATVSNATANWTLIPGTFNNYFAPNGNYCSIQWNRAGEYVLQVTAQSVCPSPTYYYPVTVGGGSYFSLMPNPASSNVQVSIMKAQSASLPSDTTKVTSQLKATFSQEVAANYTVKIYNSYGTLLYSTKKSGDSFSIPVNDLKGGSYIVEVNDGKQSYTQTLVIKH